MKYIIVGDVHGDLNQFLYPLIDYLKDPINTTLVYLGDYFDRGFNDVFIFEIMNLILTFKRLPVFENIVLLRGNHECYENGTTDFLGTFDGNKPGFVVSFLAEYVINNFELPLFYYIEELNIICSHSAHSAGSVKDLLKLNEYKNFAKYPIAKQHFSEMTCTNEYGPNHNYRNIHGHDHRPSSKSDVKNFFNNGVIKNISLDNDASYGFRAITDSTGLTLNATRPFTSLYYIMFDVDDAVASDVTFVESKIVLLSNYQRYNLEYVDARTHDFNSMPFIYVKSLLIRLFNSWVEELEYDYGRNPFVSLSMKLSNDIFVAQYRMLTKMLGSNGLLGRTIEENIHSLYHRLYKLPMFTIVTERVYLHNVPSELLYLNGCKMVNQNYIPVWLKWFEIVDPARQNLLHCIFAK